MLHILWKEYFGPSQGLSNHNLTLVANFNLQKAGGIGGKNNRMIQSKLNFVSKQNIEQKILLVKMIFPCLCFSIKITLKCKKFYIHSKNYVENDFLFCSENFIFHFCSSETNGAPESTSYPSKQLNRTLSSFHDQQKYGTQ